VRPLAIVLLASLVSACGYALAGRGNTLPAHIKIIGVPQFENQTDEPDLDLRLTDAVRQELQSRGRFTVNPEARGADAVLSAKIVSRLATPRAFTESRQVLRYEIAIIGDVTFRDETKNEVIWSNPRLRASEEYDLAGSARPEDLTSLFRQDRNAIERIARTFARTVVTSILEAF
jgi:outer membrane lipopolysaccharide assembly protein LptE/RlpB